MKAVEFTGEAVKLLDQSALPHTEEWLELKSVDEVAEAIRQMKVRGAPAIGVAAAYALAFSDKPDEDAVILKSARPTAVDLSHAVDYVLDMLRNGKNVVQAAMEWDSMNDKKCRKLSEHGASLIQDGQKILTHCNTGFIAANSYGTALGAIKMAHEQGKKIHVYVDETRPRFQGALTSWELIKAKIPHTVICDSSAAFLMSKGEIDLVMVGADRIAANGDTANKIGTYSLSVLAKEHGIPFYVLAPLSSFDNKIKSGVEIRIEERDENEILEIKGKKIYPEDSHAKNPAFDITPTKNITAFVNENGISKNIDYTGTIREEYVGVKFPYKLIEGEISEDDVRKYLKIDEKLGEILSPLENEGNMSMKIKEGFLIKRAGARMTELKDKDVSLVLEMKADVVIATGAVPSSETRLHDEIYKSAPEARVILHFHNDKLLESFEGPSIGPFPYGTVELAKAAGEAAKSNEMFMIKEHGFILTAKNEEELLKRMKSWKR